MPWFAPAVDENHPALGPPQTLLEQIKRRTEELEADGLSDAEAHNTAWDDVDFERRYREKVNYFNCSLAGSPHSLPEGFDMDSRESVAGNRSVTLAVHRPTTYFKFDYTSPLPDVDEEQSP